LRRALVSTYDKTGLAPFCARLAKLGMEILATGGTARHLRGEGVPVTDVAAFTGEPEILEGRVKTLSWRLLAGILARERDLPELEASDISPIDAVVVNLYPFWEASGHTGPLAPDELELIDVGGVTLIRAAAKNYHRVLTVVSPEKYDEVASQLGGAGDLPLPMRAQLACEAFEHLAWYDSLIAARFQAASETAGMPVVLPSTGARVSELRYGENPHQPAALYRLPWIKGGLPDARQIGGKQLSYNNLLDLDAAFGLACEFSEPAAAIIKHGSPCGCATAATLAEAYRLALSGDPMSAYGCIVGLNRCVDAPTAEAIHETFFVEAVGAPRFEEATLSVLRKKANRRYVEIPAVRGTQRDVRAVLGGLLAQERDQAWTVPEEWRVVSRREPTADERRDLEFAWRVVKHVRSNAIVLAKSSCVVGVGAGQMSRVDAALIAVRKAGERSRGAVMASDGFLPMPDTLEAAAEAGVTAVVEPGGSKGDPKVIASADEKGVALLFTGRRHFRH
jgi:phosphoribosylaminoimidazolecarboxamide formyltransferase/IMP cyclohydrolase